MDSVPLSYCTQPDISIDDIMEEEMEHQPSQPTVNLPQGFEPPVLNHQEGEFLATFAIQHCNSAEYRTREMRLNILRHEVDILSTQAQLLVAAINAVNQDRAHLILSGDRLRQEIRVLRHYIPDSSIP